MSAGRPRKPIENLQLEGTYRADRHKNVGDSKAIALPKDTVLEAPAQYSAKTKKCWEAIVPTLIVQGILSESDLPSLDLMFQSYEEFLKAKAAIKKFDKEHPDLLEKEVIDNRKKLNAWLSQSINDFNKIAARFGIMPSERVKSMNTDSKKKEDPLEVVIGY